MPNHEQIIKQALGRIDAGYVFPEKAVDIDAAIRRRLAAGEYDGLDGPALCETVTAHLQEVCPDKHLRLLWVEEPQSLEPEDQDAGRAAFLELLRAENQGVRRVEQLDGGVALVDIRRIPAADEGAAVVGAAMRLAASSSALVLDLRECRGGAPEGAAMWCSYFFPDDQVHLNDIYDRATGTTRQFWTSAHLPAPRYLDRPVYVLTSAITFSGGEDVAYTLQAHGRAILVGETTRGGAHPTDRHAVTEHIQVTVPTARTISTVTGGNWEGVGVVPDVPVPADQALDTALKAIRATEARPSS
ncbi:MULTISPECIES: S41 family peptidase [unclassified Streptomyces]|uniref:S41 family peptidase n=1 Tax=unclassified Streptomyces TaxID=2593676 RepID=UPI001BEB3E96|nr:MULTISPECIES: S41 family peptidase [unclassified Streptomyces]MBT2407800.1 S41 family peptidase [Streptomyces sp. ISL-21]MBT2456731.1 S41 family peptidase [Streptomyces sp. ISL-86]MBT2608510.1 S41 family peptidase [Streptomyces sp. ISL-87]